MLKMHLIDGTNIYLPDLNQLTVDYYLSKDGKEYMFTDGQISKHRHSGVKSVRIYVSSIAYISEV